jgi:hypothetical protein
MVARDLKSLVSEFSFLPSPRPEGGRGLDGQDSRAIRANRKQGRVVGLLSRDSKSLATGARPPGETIRSPSKTRGCFCTGYKRTDHAAGAATSP